MAGRNSRRNQSTSGAACSGSRPSVQRRFAINRSRSWNTLSANSTRNRVRTRTRPMKNHAGFSQSASVIRRYVSVMASCSRRNSLSSALTGVAWRRATSRVLRPKVSNSGGAAGLPASARPSTSRKFTGMVLAMWASTSRARKPR